MIYGGIQVSWWLAIILCVIGLIIGQKIVILLNAVNIAIQAAGARKQLVVKSEFVEPEKSQTIAL